MSYCAKVEIYWKMHSQKDEKIANKSQGKSCKRGNSALLMSLGKVFGKLSKIYKNFHKSSEQILSNRV